MTEKSLVVLRRCKFCRDEIFASEDSYSAHLLFHIDTVINEICLSFRYWCHVCNEPRRHDSNYRLRQHLKTSHSMCSIINYYVKQINDGIISS